MAKAKDTAQTALSIGVGSANLVKATIGTLGQIATGSLFMASLYKLQKAEFEARARRRKKAETFAKINQLKTDRRRRKVLKKEAEYRINQMKFQQKIQNKEIIIVVLVL